MKKRIIGLAGNLAMAALALVVTIVLVDLVAFYVLDIKPKSYKSERFFEPSPLYGHVHRPNAEGYWYRYVTGEKYYVRTNSFGFADSERTVEKDRPRIALIGDSTTEFWEMDEGDRGQYVLEKELGGRYEVLNLGVRGYGTDQTYLLFKEVGLRFDPDIAIYTFCVNDVHDNGVREGKPYFVLAEGRPDSLVLAGVPVDAPVRQPEHGVLYERSFVFRLLQDLRNTLQLGTRLRKLLGRDATPPLHFELRCYRADYTEGDRRNMNVTLALISELNELARSQGVRFMVVEGIYKPAVDPGLRRDVKETFGEEVDFGKLTDTLASHCRQEGIPFVSLPQVVVERGIDVRTLMHSRDNMHLNAEGVRLYVDVVAEALRSQGWVTAQ